MQPLPEDRDLVAEIYELARRLNIRMLAATNRGMVVDAGITGLSGQPREGYGTPEIHVNILRHVVVLHDDLKHAEARLNCTEVQTLTVTESPVGGTYRLTGGQYGTVGITVHVSPLTAEVGDYTTLDALRRNNATFKRAEESSKRMMASLSSGRQFQNEESASDLNPPPDDTLFKRIK